jgi:hypothetical protein
MQHKGQSAIEFITTYGMVFLVIIVAVTAVAMFISFPATILPSVCTFYSGFNCVDSLFVPNTIYGGSTLYVAATYGEPGVFSILSFNAVLGNRNSTLGSCTPNTLVDGESTFCVAQFPMTPANGSTYYGTIKVQGNYCANSAQNLTDTTCLPTNGIFNFSGNIRIQPTATENVPCSASVLCYIPITITDTNTIQGIPSGFQEEISIKPSSAAYNAYEANDLGNVRFQYDGRNIPSWCEVNCYATSTSNAIFWVKLPVALQATGTAGNSITVWMRFLSTSTEYDGVDAGEAPQLSPSYGEYDNGVRLFNYYQSFAGNALPSGWAATNALTVVDNGISISHGSAYTTAPIFYSLNRTVEMYAEYTALSGAEYSGIMQANGDAPQGGNNGGNAEILWMTNNGGNVFYAWAANGIAKSYNLQGGTSSGFTPTVNTFYTFGSWVSATQVGETEDYTNLLTATGTYDKNQYIILGYFVGASAGSTAINPVTIKWVRVRDWPLTGTMPGYTMGSFTKVS